MIVILSQIIHIKECISSYIFATIFALRSKTASNISHPRPQNHPVRYDHPIPLMIFHWAYSHDSSQRVPYRSRSRFVYYQKAIEKVFNCVFYLNLFFKHSNLDLFEYYQVVHEFPLPLQLFLPFDWCLHFVDRCLRFHQ